MRNRNRNIIEVSVDAIKANKLLRKTIKWLSIGVVLYYQPSLFIVPACNKLIEYL
jgi:hypothetical protein